MGMKGNAGAGQGTLDAGLGLIFRLNALWNRVDNYALAGEMDKWNFTLDRIFSNLSYRDDMEITYVDPRERMEAKKIITDIQLAPREKKIHDKFKALLKKAKLDKTKAIKLKSRADYNKAREDEYDTLMKKDIWLRKYMQQLKLYIKESEFDATKAMWGG